MRYKNNNQFNEILGFAQYRGRVDGPVSPRHYLAGQGGHSNFRLFIAGSALALHVLNFLSADFLITSKS